MLASVGKSVLIHLFEVCVFTHLEFVEEHEELHELYEEPLKALLGISIDELEKETRLDKKGNKI